MDKRKECDYKRGIRRMKCCPFHIEPHGRDSDYEFIRNHNRKFKSDYNEIMGDIKQSTKDNKKRAECHKNNFL